METNGWNIRDFGARGDGQTDDTAAIQAAIDACEPGGVVFVPSGVFPCADVRVKPHITLRGGCTWGYRDKPDTGACLLLSRADASCLLDVTDAVGCTLTGLSLLGGRLGENVHGVQIAKTDGYGAQEDAIRVEKCRVTEFSGDALHLGHVWCATVQDNMLSSSRNGLYIDGWDLFIYNNWLTANANCGIYGVDSCNTAILCEGNRIEWNYREGIRSERGVTWVLTGNHFDRNGREGAAFLDGKHINITGNTFARDGWRALPDEISAGLSVLRSRGVSVQSNVFRSLGGDPKQQERHSPDYDLHLQGLHTAVVRGNVMYQAAVIDNLLDEGGHTETVLADNVGSIAGDDC